MMRETANMKAAMTGFDLTAFLSTSVNDMRIGAISTTVTAIDLGLIYNGTLLLLSLGPSRSLRRISAVQ